MALSNIFKEPRREIIETVIGVTLLFGGIYADFAFSCWLVSDVPNPADRHFATVLAMFICVAAFFLLRMAIIAAHGLGDSVCNKLNEMGADPRPRQRYR